MSIKEELEIIYQTYYKLNEQLRPTYRSFVVDKVFRLTTYNSYVDEFLYEDCMVVAFAIAEHPTFEAIEEVSKEKYFTYIRICNYPFFKNIISWYSIGSQGAWFDLKDPVFIRCGNRTIAIETNDDMLELLNAIRDMQKEVDSVCM